MHNPLRSEAEAFRWAVTIAVGAGAVIALTLLTEPVFGVILGACLLGLGTGILWRGARGRIPEPPDIASARDDLHRILVVANQTVGGRALLEEIRNRSRGKRSEIHVVTPALTSSGAKHWASDVDEAMEEAKRRLDASLAAMSQQGIEATGEVGDSDPYTAMRDALRLFAADELIISTHPPGRSRWLERGVVERAQEEIGLPVTHVVVDLEAESGTPASA